MQISNKSGLGLIALGGALLLLQATGVAQTRPGGFDASSLQLSITDMKKEINALKADVAALQATNNALKAQVAAHEQGFKPLWSQVNQDCKRLDDLKAAYATHRHPQSPPVLSRFSRFSIRPVKPDQQVNVVDLDPHDFCQGTQAKTGPPSN